MTTLVYKDGILAADSMSVMDGRIKQYGEKKLFSFLDCVTKRNNLIYGFAGDVRFLPKFDNLFRQAHDLDDGSLLFSLCNWDRICPQDLVPADACMVLAINRRERIPYILFGDGTYALEPANGCAVGAGAGVAMGALAMGATAIEAVQVAIDLDIETGGEVQALSFDL